MSRLGIAVAVVVLAMFCRMSVLGQGEDWPRITDRQLGQISGANPNQLGYGTLAACAVASGYPSRCTSVNIGASCIVCGEFQPYVFLPLEQGESRITNPTLRTCNYPAYIGTCTLSQAGTYFCDVPTAYNGQCQGEITGYSEQSE